MDGLALRLAGDDDLEPGCGAPPERPEGGEPLRVTKGEGGGAAREAKDGVHAPEHLRPAEHRDDRAGELPPLAAERTRLVHDSPDLVEGELRGFVGRAGGKLHPAVPAGVVAPVGVVEGAFQGKAGKLLQDRAHRGFRIPDGKGQRWVPSFWPRFP